MKYRYLGNTGLQVSEVCLGTMTFGRESSFQDSQAIWNATRDAGINFVDTANVYSHGESEKIVGTLLKDCREEFVLATKARYPIGEGLNQQGFSRKHLVGEVENSLKRLQTDRLDLFYLHAFDDRVPLEEVARTLEYLVLSGKVLHLGVSNFSAWQVMKLLGIQEKSHWAKLCVIQPMLNLLKRQAEVELLPLAQSENLGFVPYSPLGGGVLTGKYKLQQAQSNSRLHAFSQYHKRYQTLSLDDQIVDYLSFCESIACTPVQVAIAWVLQKKGVTSSLLGARNLEQFASCLRALEIQWDPAWESALDVFFEPPALATDRAEERS